MPHSVTKLKPEWVSFLSLYKMKHRKPKIGAVNIFQNRKT